MNKTQENINTEIAEKFMETFNINNCDIGTKRQCSKYNSLECYYCDNKYPEITSDILLKLICILVQWDKDYEYLITSKYIDDLKQEILNDCIQGAKQFNEYFVEQVQSLFTGGYYKMQ